MPLGVLSVVASAILVALTSSAHGRSIWVDGSAPPDGDGSMEHPFARISDGVAAANDATDVRPVQVLVLPGTYLDEDLPITIERPRTHLVKVGVGAATIVTPAGFGDVGILVTASRVVVAGFELSGSGNFAVAAIGSPDAPIFGVGFVGNRSKGFFGGAKAGSASGWMAGNTFIGGHIGIIVAGSDVERGGASWRVYRNRCADNEIAMCFIGGLDPTDYSDGTAAGGPIQIAGATDAEVFDNVILGQSGVALNLLYRGIYPIIDQPAELAVDFHDNLVADAGDVHDIEVGNLQYFFLGACPDEDDAPGTMTLSLADNDFQGPASADFVLGVGAAYGTIPCGPMASGTSLSVWDPDGSLASDYSVYNPPDAGNAFTVYRDQP